MQAGGNASAGKADVQQAAQEVAAAADGAKTLPLSSEISSPGPPAALSPFALLPVSDESNAITGSKANIQVSGGPYASANSCGPADLDDPQHASKKSNLASGTLIDGTNNSSGTNTTDVESLENSWWDPKALGESTFLLPTLHASTTHHCIPSHHVLSIASPHPEWTQPSMQLAGPP